MSADYCRKTASPDIQLWNARTFRPPIGNSLQPWRKFRKLFSSFLGTALLCGASVSPGAAETICSKDTSEGKELNLPIYSWANSAVPTKAIIFAIHGVTLHSGNFDETARHLASEGYPVYAMDMRGFGRWQSEAKTFSGDDGIHYTQTEQDLEVVLKKLRSEYPDKKTYVLGESIGANLALWLAAKEPEALDGIILSSPCIKACFHPMPRMVVDFFRGCMHPNTRHQTRPYIAHFISDDKRVTEAYFADPLVMHQMSPAEMFKSLKTNTRTLLTVKDIPQQLPILIVAGQKDQIYHAAAIPLFAEQLGSENKTIVIEPNKGHILLETKFVEPRILTVIDNWLAKTVPQSQAQPEKISSVGQTSAEASP